MGYDEKALEKKEDTGNVLSDEVQNSLIEAIPTRRVHFHEPFIFELCTMFVYLNNVHHSETNGDRCFLAGQ